MKCRVRQGKLIAVGWGDESRQVRIIHDATIIHVNLF